jgi:hypothetical protein
VLDREFDCLVIAKLEMQERMVLDCAPMTTVKRVGTDEVDGTGDPASVALGHYQEDAIAHPLAHQGIERPGEIGPAPFA